MNPDFWLKRWQENTIGWHGRKANPLLVKYFNSLSLKKGSRVFIPLCGKTLDIAWLLSEGYQVVGAELSEIAIEQLFTELGVEPKITQLDNLHHYSAEGIDIFVGDIFNTSSEVLEEVDAIYDRAALVALPPKIRDRYSVHLRNITNNAPQLLITFEYDQAIVDGPPFSISIDEIYRQYEDVYKVAHLESIELANKLQGKAEAKESVWLLS